MKKLFAFALALCLMCGMLPALAEGGVKVSAGPLVFELPEGAKITQQKNAGKNAYTFTANCVGRSVFGGTVKYEVTGLVYQYDPAEVSEQGVMDYQTFYLLTGMLFGKSAMATFSPMNGYADMPDGQALLMSFAKSGNKSVTIMSHYYDCVGFMLALTAPSGDFVDHTLMQAGETIAESVKPVADLAEGESLGTITITNASANIRTAPNGSADKVATAYKGDSFPWLGEENGWYKIMVNGQIGYVAKGLCKVGQ